MRQQPPGTYRGYRNAGIRMSEELAPELVHGREQDERSGLYATHMYDKAHALMLTEQGIIPADAGVALLMGLRRLESEPGGAVEARVRVGGGMHSGEYYLIRELGEEVGGWDHVGRSSVCLAVVARRILERDAMLDALEALNGFRRALLELAEPHLDAIMPGVFRTQAVQPMSFGHYLLGAAQRFERDFDRARDAFARVNLNPGGGVVLTGTSFPIDRERVAELLGFDGVVINAADATLGNDAALEGFGVLAILASHVSRLTSDFDRWVASENRYIDLADRYGAGSSLAMNMKTPMFPGAGLTENVLGDLVKAFSPAGTLGGLNPDGPFRAMAGVLRLYAQILATVTFDRDRAANATRRIGYLGGTDLGALLVTARGLSWRTAHQICGILFRHAVEQELASDEISGAMLDEAALEYFGRPLALTTAEIQAAMDPETILASRTHTGGSARAEAVRQLEALRASMVADQAWLSSRRERIAAAAERLEAGIDRVLRPAIGNEG